MTWMRRKRSGHGSGGATQQHTGRDRPGHGRRQRPDRRAVDDQHRHRRRRLDRRSGRSAGPRRLGAGADHRRSRRGGARRAAHPRSAGRARHRRAADRRLPLHRPQAADREPGLRRGAGQVPDQSRQRRLSRKARPPVLDDDRGGAEVRQAGAHRGQLGQPRPGTAGPADGRERGVRRAEDRRRGDPGGDGGLGDRERPPRRGPRARRRPHHPVVQGQRGAEPDRRLSARWPTAATMPCISA